MNRNLQVFKEEPGFLKLFNLFREKYHSLGRIGGTVSLKAFSQTELESIAGFMGQSYEYLIKKGSLALADFEKELANTGFSEFTLFSLLEHVFEEKIRTKKEEQEQENQQEAAFIRELMQIIPEATWWLEWVQSKSVDTRWIWSLYKQNAEELSKKMVTVFNAFTETPKDGEFEQLPFFSQRTTGNPHYFDPSKETGKLLIHCMTVDRFLKGQQDSPALNIPRGAEELNECMAEYGIVRDDLWNFVTCQGLLAAKGDEPHPVWEAASQMQSVLNIPMKELAKVDRIWPVKGKKVWIVENSSVASLIMEALPGIPIICTHGQFRLASWRLIDLLAQSNCTLYYSGDLDPEGILIAERLKRRYYKQVVIWRMDRETYKRSLSNEPLTNRLVKLNTITSSNWKEVISLMKKNNKAGYQEAIVSSLIEDIKSLSNES